MKLYRVNILVIIIFSVSIFGCKSINHLDTHNPKYKHVKGNYYRNIAQGWTRPDANTEIIPDIPQYQLLRLESFRKFKFNDVGDSTIFTGKWKIEQDTLILTYKNKVVEQYYIDMPSIRNGACLKKPNSKKVAFCRSNEDLVAKYEKPRIVSELNRYDNGKIESNGLVKYFYNKPDNKMKKRIGKWLFFNENEELIRSCYYVKGVKIWTKNYKK